jgi:hypothetical protein
VLQQEPPRERKTAESTPGPTPAPKREAGLPTAGPALAAVRKKQAATRRRAERRGTAFAGGDPATRHEREAAISPPVETAGAQPAEFEPGPAAPVSQAPAAAPSTGAPEFP